MSVGQLILHPQQAFATPPSPQVLVARLKTIGLLGGEWEQSRHPQRFLAGERFLQLISFLGCSPHIEVAPPSNGGDAFCYLEIHGPWEQPKFLGGRNTRPPGCPNCGRKQAGFQRRLQPWQALPESLVWRCPDCEAEHPPAHWKWRQQGGAGRIAVVINSIFPNEALPSDELLTGLESLGTSPWTYCYIQETG